MVVRHPCGCEQHEVDGRKWSAACQAHGGWLPSTLPIPIPSARELRLRELRQQEQVLIDQLEAIQEAIAVLEEETETSSERKRSRVR